MNLVFFGPPGAGKGTVASRLSEEFSIPHISTGDLFRAAIKQESKLGKQVKSILESGALVPDSVTNELIRQRLSANDLQNGYILDGYPRTLDQAETLAGFSKLGLVVNFTIPEGEIIKRLTGRRVCRNCGHSHHILFLPPKKDGVCDKCGGELYLRDDDTETSIRKRLSVYTEQTEPLIDYYRQKNLLVDIDAAPQPDTVYRSVHETVGAKKG